MTFEATIDCNFPLAYFITFATYGVRLHGDSKGSIDRLHNSYGGEVLPANPKQYATALRLMTAGPCALDAGERQTVLSAIVACMSHRNWNLLAVHVRSNHVHLVLQAGASPEKLLSYFKAYASRALNHRYGTRARRWSRHGSTRYLWSAADVRSAVRYVVDEQGLPMAVWVNPEPNPISPFAE
jgi:REP element-mobilizing transposase RayT